MEVKAKVKFDRLAPTKIRSSVGIIKGRQVDEAIEILNFMEKRSAKEVGKVLKSALSNAKNNFDLKGESLYVKEAVVGKGPSYKKVKPRARGRADLIKRRTSHISVTLESR